MDAFADLETTGWQDLDSLGAMDEEGDEDTDLILENPKDCYHLVTFRLGGEKYGMNILKVQEIIRYIEVTPIPNMPDFVKGVTNLRGTILPVLDLRIRFGMPPGHYEDSEFAIILIVYVGAKQVGIIADAIADVIFLPKSTISPPPDFPTLVDTDFIQGMGEIRNEMVILLNIDKILSEEEMKQQTLLSPKAEKVTEKITETQSQEREGPSQ